MLNLHEDVVVGSPITRGTEVTINALSTSSGNHAHTAPTGAFRSCSDSAWFV
jgi:hypothetical protein